MARVTDRRWHPPNVVGMVGPHDVEDLQLKVKTYHEALLVALDAWVRAGNKLPDDNSTWSSQAWDALSSREASFEAESMAGWNPLAYLYAGASYERGRELIDELDKWRDHFAEQKMPDVPNPVPVPHSDVGLAGGLGFALAAVVAILVLREMK